MRIVPFSREHIDGFDMGQEERLFLTDNDLKRISENWDDTVLTAFDGKALGFFVCLFHERGVTISALLSDELRARPYALHRIGREVLSLLDGPVFADCRKGFAAGEKWLERFGFVPVGQHTRNRHVIREYALWDSPQ